MSAEPPDISQPVRQLIERLGLNPDDVRALTIDASKRHVEATLYLRNEQGAKYVNENGEPALTTITIAANAREPAR